MSPPLQGNIDVGRNSASFRRMDRGVSYHYCRPVRPRHSDDLRGGYYASIRSVAGHSYTTQRKDRRILPLWCIGSRIALQAGLEEMCVLVCVVRHAARKVLILLIVRLSNTTYHCKVYNVETDSMCEVSLLSMPIHGSCVFSLVALRSQRRTIPGSRRQAASNVGQLVPYGES